MSGTASRAGQNRRRTQIPPAAVVPERSDTIWPRRFVPPFLPTTAPVTRPARPASRGRSTVPARSATKWNPTLAAPTTKQEQWSAIRSSGAAVWRHESTRRRWVRSPSGTGRKGAGLGQVSVLAVGGRSYRGQPSRKTAGCPPSARTTESIHPGGAVGVHTTSGRLGSPDACSVRHRCVVSTARRHVGLGSACNRSMNQPVSRVDGRSNAGRR